ncbi:MAG: hypothetical protein U1E39_18370 [Planctomycetota bacterium]
MRSIAARAALLLGCAVLAPSVRADIVVDSEPPRPRDAAPAEAGTSTTVKWIVVVGGLVLAGILIALLYRRRDASAAVQP